MLHKLFKNTIIYAIGPQIPRIVSIFLLPLLTKHLTSYDYGIWALISVYNGLFSGLKILGMSQPMVNAFFKNKNHWKLHWRIMMGFLQAWSLLFNLLLSLFLWHMLPHDIEIYKKIIVVLSIGLSGVLFDTTITFGFRYFQLSEKPIYIMFITITTGFINIFLNIYTIVFLKLGFMGWAISSFVNGLVTFTFLFYPLYIKERIIPIFNYRWLILKHHLRIGLPTIPDNYSSYLLNASDRIVMDYYKIPTAQIGLYSFAYNFGSLAEMGGEAMGMALSPIHTKILLAKNELKAKRLIFTLQYFFIILFFIIALWIKEIFSVLVSNKELSNTYLMASLILFSYCYRPLYWGTVNLLGISGKTSQLWKISFAAGIVNLALNMILIPIYGYKIAIITTFLGLMYYAIAGYFLKAYKSISNENYHPLKWISAIIIIFISLFWLVDMHWEFKLLITSSLLFILIKKIIEGTKILNIE